MKNIFSPRCTGERKTRTIVLFHQKGGTGKTTSCLNIAGWLTKMKNIVLVIDLDPQGNATSGLGIDRTSCENSIYDVLFRNERLSDVILETESGVFLVPSSIDLLAGDFHMADPGENTHLLKRAMKCIDGCFDYVLIDTPPGSTHLMINGLVAASDLILPLDSGVFAYEALDILNSLFIDLHDELKIDINIMMMILRQTKSKIVNGGSTRMIFKLAKKFLIRNRMSYVKIIKIPCSRKINRAQVRGLPISHYAPRSSAGKAYKRVSKELIGKY